MSIKDLFTLIIKIIGVYALIKGIYSIILNYSLMASVDSTFEYTPWIIAIVSLGVTILVINNADKIVTKLKLDKGFDNQEIKFGNLNSLEIIKIALIIIGGGLFVNNFPHIVLSTRYFIKESISKVLIQRFLDIEFIVSVIYSFIGYVLVTSNTAIAKWIDKKNTE